MTQFILALCGLPAAGKSALADAIQAAMNVEVEIVRTDEWRDDEYYTDWKPEKEGPVRQSALNKVKEFVAQGKNVIHDDTNYYTSMRHELFQIAVENRLGFAIIHVTTPVSAALKWNKERPDTRIPDSVIEDIFERFDLPGRRYLWDNSELDVDMETQELESVVPEIIEILEDIEPALKPKPELITPTEFDRLDTATRTTVSEFLQAHPELRGNRAVSIIRRSALSIASENKIPIKDVHELLWAELTKLL
jgi:O-phosphoseryl-tRNA(Sec) kinase